MPAHVTKENVNSIFFDGFYKEMWRTAIPAGLTEHEVGFMLQYFNLQPGSKVLDLMCGYGRHTLGLARKAVQVTAVDNLSEYISDLQKIVDEENLPVNYRAADIMSFKAEESVDLAICMGNSLNFFDETDAKHIMSVVAEALKPGGNFLINSWSLAEIVMKDFREKNWSYIGDYKFLTDSRFLFNPTRIETESFIIDKDGHTEQKKGVDYIFSLAEMEKMLTGAGLFIKEVFSIPGKKKFVLGEPRAYIIAEKK